EERTRGDVQVLLGAVFPRGLAEPVEQFDRGAVGGVVGAQHERGDRADQHRPAHPPAAVAADVAGDFAAAGGEAHQGDVAQVQRGDHRGQVVGVVVHVVAVPGLARTAVAAPVVGDDAVALGGEEQHLRFPAVRVQRPAVAEGDDRAVLGAPVLEVQAHAVGGHDVVAVDGGGARGVLQVGGRGGGGGRGGAAVDGQGEQAGGEGAGDGVHGGVLVWRAWSGVSRRSTT